MEKLYQQTQKEQEDHLNQYDVKEPIFVRFYPLLLPQVIL